MPKAWLPARDTNFAKISRGRLEAPAQTPHHEAGSPRAQIGSTRHRSRGARSGRSSRGLNLGFDAVSALARCNSRAGANTPTVFLKVAMSRRQTEGDARNSPTDPRHEPGQPAVGRSPDPWRTPQARHRCWSNLGCQVARHRGGASHDHEIKATQSTFGIASHTMRSMRLSASL